MKTAKRVSTSSPNAGFKSALAAIETEVEKKHGRVRHEQIAKGIGVASSAVSGWFRGRQTPRDKYIEGLAEFYAHGDKGLQQQYRSRLYTAAGRNEKAAEKLIAQERENSSPLDQARSPTGKIKIGIVEYFAISQFFRTILEAFAKFDSFNLQIMPDEQFLGLADGIQKKVIGLGAPILATANRALHLSFIETPIEVAVNAMTFRGALKDREELSFDPMRKSIRPIFNEAEVGGRFASQTLGFENWDADICSNYSPINYTEFLFEHWKNWQSASQDERVRQRVPVIFADELTCLHIQRDWLRRIKTIKDENDPATLVLLLGNSVGSDVPQIHAPDPFHQSYTSKYRVCMCVHRNDRDDPDHWPEYIVDAWRIFLHGNSDFISREYASLYLKLMDEIGPFELVASGTNLHELWKERIERWLRLDAMGDSPDIGSLLFSDEVIWRKIVHGASAIIKRASETNPHPKNS